MGRVREGVMVRRPRCGGLCHSFWVSDLDPTAADADFRAHDFRAKPTLVGDLVTLVPVGMEHVARLAELMADPEVTRLTGSAHTTAELGTMVPEPAVLEEVYGRWATATDRMVWVVIERSTGQLVGEVVLNDLDPGNHSCGFRIWLSGGRDRGLGTQATWLAVNHALVTVGLNRVSLEVYAFNPRARRVYQKVGFVSEGTLRQALRFDGAWIDAEVMAVLAQDWPGWTGPSRVPVGSRSSLRAGFSPGDFDRGIPAR